MVEIYGRDAEIASVLAAVRASGARRAAVIEGPAGIGKTVVLDAALEVLQIDGWRLLSTRPSENEARMSLLALHDLLDPIIEQLRPGLPERQALDLDAALGTGSVDRPVDEGRLGLAVLAGLRLACATQRTIIAIDDVQWLDRSSASALETALRRMADPSLGVIATRRVPGVTPPLPLARTFGPDLVRVRLEPISVGAMHRMIVTRLGRSLARPTLVRIHEASGGNPLYALEFARALETAAASDEGFDASVPDDTSDLLWRRIQGLPPLGRDVLLVTALATRPSTDLAAAVLGVDRPAVARVVSLPSTLGLLQEEAGTLRLGHPLVGSVVRHRTTGRRRRELHARLADLVADDDEAALHRALAADGPDEPAAAAVEASARRAFARGARIDALDRYDRAIQLTPPERTEEIARRRVGLAEAAIVAGDTERALAELGSLDIPALTDPEVRAEAATIFGAAAWLAGRSVEAAELLERLLADPSIPDNARARIHLRLGLLYEADRWRGAVHYEKAIALLDPERSPGDYASALLGLAANRLHLQHGADHEAVHRGAELQAIDERWDASTLPLNWPIWMDDWPTARRISAEERRKALDLGDETSVSYELTLSVEIDLWSGHLDSALRTAERAIEHADSTGQSGRRVSALALRALVQAHRGELAAAEADATRVLEGVEGPRRSTTLLAHALAALGAAARARDDLAGAERHLSRALAALDAAGDIDQPIHRFHGDLLDALVGLGEHDRAVTLVDRVARSGSLGPRPRRTALAERGRALLAMADGRLDDARRHVDAALAQYRHVDVPFDEARTLHVAGQLERRAGHRRIAAGHLDAAVRLFAQVGARGWAERATREVTRLGMQRGVVTELTPSEERIATLAASGLRNHEIAARLLISAKTVEANLARAYAKLGIRTRAELAVALAAARDSAQPSTSGNATT